MVSFDVLLRDWHYFKCGYACLTFLSILNVRALLCSHCQPSSSTCLPHFVPHFLLGIPRTVLREISILIRLQHPNVARLVDVIQSSKSIVLVYEYLDHDLKTYLDAQNGEGLSIDLVKVCP